MRMYSLTEDKLPHIGIIDPRTGAKVVSILVTDNNTTHQFIDSRYDFIHLFLCLYSGVAGIHWSARTNAEISGIR